MSACHFRQRQGWVDPLNVFELLASSGPFPGLEDKLMLYGRFVGSWDLRVAWFKPTGTTISGRGEWHFAWILGGRGIQDVLFASGAPRHEFGTSLRCYDPVIDAWRITWMHPAGDEYAHLIGRESGDRIVQAGVGSEPDQVVRWTFVDIEADSFRWLSEISRDDGVSWFLEQEIQAARRGAKQEPDTA